MHIGKSLPGCTALSDPSRGSAQVEAAMIIPLVVLLIAGMLKLGIHLSEKVETSSAGHSAAAENIIDGGALPAESILRGRWYIK